jgi:hypothetical protein
MHVLTYQIVEHIYDEVRGMPNFDPCLIYSMVLHMIGC